MDKNYIKMENSECNNMSSMWFNAQLFTVNEAPLKFYLIGYSQIEFYEMIKIIQAYGGELSKPDTPGTFVFCEPANPAGAKKWDYYDIKYFDDSIIALKPQDLMNYKLKVSRNQAVEHKLMHLKHESGKLMDLRSHRGQKNNTEDLNKTKIRNSCDRVKSRGHPSASKSSSGLDRLKDSFRECYVKLERLDDSKIGIKTKYLQIHDQNDDNQVIDKKKRPNSSEDEGDSDYSVVSRTTDDSHHRSSWLSSGRSGKKKSGVTGRESGFSDGDNEKIIKWLIKKNSMPTDTGRKIWRELLEEKVLPSHDITVFKLMKHYNQNLKHHPIFRKYIEDTKTSRRLVKSENIHQ